MRGTIEKLITISRENNSVFWRDIAERLNAGSRRYSSINVGKISRLATEGETVVVAGSVLGSGFVDKKVTVSALAISENARKKLEENGSTFKSLEELAAENPKGSNLRILR
ncbi:MAG: 50S ribosomal protein L18e [Candidatus Thermoplasmatota archaeon]|nr:50S ribosomal protein L18e [Candidatus Thermoplasmatota archaeon]